MKAYGEWRYSSTILDLGTGWRRVVSFTPRPLYPEGKSPRYTLCSRLAGLPRHSGRCGEKKSLASVGNWTPAFQLVARRYTDWAIPTPHMSYHNSDKILFVAMVGGPVASLSPSSEGLWWLWRLNIHDGSVFNGVSKQPAEGCLLACLSDTLLSDEEKGVCRLCGPCSFSNKQSCVQGLPTWVADTSMEAQTPCGLNLLRRPLSWLILDRCDYYDYVDGYGLVQPLQSLLHI
jgi:hypothetical protein